MTLVQRIGVHEILPQPVVDPIFEEEAIQVEAGDIRSAAADAIVQRAQVAGDRATVYTPPMMTNAIAFTVLFAYGLCMNYFASVMMYEITRNLLKTPVGQPIYFVGNEVVRGAVTGVVSATGLCQAQFEGTNPDYRPSTADVMGKLKEKSVEHVFDLSSRVKQLVV